jgi:hypothetical protein
VYKITIEKLEEVEEREYPKRTTVYEQTVSYLDIKDVIRVVNQIPEPL